jgi:hypothetical protein
MSANSVGWTRHILYKRNSTVENNGNTSLSGVSGGWVGNSGGQVGWATLNVNVAHTHNVYVKSSDNETKPSNFTKKLWVRTN